MKKIKREMEPIVFRSLKSPGLEGPRQRQGRFGIKEIKYHEKTQEKMENDKPEYEDFFFKSRKNI